MTEANLVRFINSQAHIYTQVVEELTNGRTFFHNSRALDEVQWQSVTLYGI